jgi:hypothetical protein
MSETTQAHTQGPWTWGRLVDVDTGEPLRGDSVKRYISGCIDRGDPDDFFFLVLCEKPDGPADVCHTGNGPTSRANARLIAAAPDLLEAVRAQIAYDDRPEAEDVAGTKEAFDRRMRIYDSLKAAIAKAEGR